MYVRILYMHLIQAVQVVQHVHGHVADHVTRCTVCLVPDHGLPNALKLWVGLQSGDVQVDSCVSGGREGKERVEEDKAWEGGVEERERDTYPLIFGPLYSSYSML